MISSSALDEKNKICKAAADNFLALIIWETNMKGIRGTEKQVMLPCSVPSIRSIMSACSKLTQTMDPKARMGFRTAAKGFIRDTHNTICPLNRRDMTTPTLGHKQAQALAGLAVQWASTTGSLCNSDLFQGSLRQAGLRVKGYFEPSEAVGEIQHPAPYILASRRGGAPSRWPG